MKLHHIGIVVSNISESMGELTKFLKFEKIKIPEIVESQDVNVCFLKISGVFIELIEPISSASPVQKFSSAGGGFHHLCFEVDNLTSELEKMEKNGARIIVQPTRGFENRLIAFVMLNLKHSNCNLIELVEKN